MSGFVQAVHVVKVATDPVTPAQEDEAVKRLGARVGKYYNNREQGMEHGTALDEAVKP